MNAAHGAVRDHDRVLRVAPDRCDALRHGKHRSADGAAHHLQHDARELLSALGQAAARPLKGATREAR